MKSIKNDHANSLKNDNAGAIDNADTVKRKRRSSKDHLNGDCLDFATKYLLSNDTYDKKSRNSDTNDCSNSAKNFKSTFNDNDDYFLSGIDIDTGITDSNIQAINVNNNMYK